MGVKSFLLGAVLAAGAISYYSSVPNNTTVSSAERDIVSKPVEERQSIERWKSSSEAKRLDKKTRTDVISHWREDLAGKREGVRWFIDKCKTGDNDACNAVTLFMKDIKTTIEEGPSSNYLEYQDP